MKGILLTKKLYPYNKKECGGISGLEETVLQL